MDFLNTSGVTIASTILHSVGVLGLMVALAFVVVWHHRWRSGLPRDVIRKQIVVVFWVSAVANVIGGTLRTIQPGHPGLSQFVHSVWVQTMVWKHLFVVVSLAGLAYLIYRVIPWQERRYAAGARNPRVPAAQGIAITLTVLGIVGGSVLGAFAQSAPVHGDDGEFSGGPMPGEVPAIQTRYHNVTGTLTAAGPLAPGEASGTFEVEEFTKNMRAVLTWPTEQVTITLQLTSPSGEMVNGEPDGTATAVAALASPEAGEWAWAISSDAAPRTEWALSVQLSENPTNELLLEGSATIPSGRFFEINTVMPLNGTFCWDWTATSDVAFDVHSHFDDEVEYYVERTNSGESACFTNEREGGYSLLWEATGATPVQLDYRVWGDFTVHSYFP